jgi:hypothetical protein
MFAAGFENQNVKETLNGMRKHRHSFSREYLITVKVEITMEYNRMVSRDCSRFV